MVEIIGSVQRRAFEREAKLNAGSSVTELAEALDVSHETIRRHLRTAERLWGVRSQSRGAAKSLADGTALSGRPVLEYYLPEGHRWVGVGQRPAAAVLAGRADGSNFNPSVITDDGARTIDEHC